MLMKRQARLIDELDRPSITRVVVTKRER